MKLKDLEKRVRAVLKDEPATRGSDDLLYIRIIGGLGVDLNSVTAMDFILNYRKQKLPTIETIGRCRRRIQARDKTLKPTPDIELKRKKLEDSFYFYSL